MKCEYLFCSKAAVERPVTTDAAFSLPVYGRFNEGSSLGLQYPFIFSNDRVWCRHCGQIFYKGQNAMDRCYELNGAPKWPDAETLEEIDMTP